ncbi:slipin family protein [Natronoglycomyces albus]|uniref:Slipin family protein n=1 Tax=Natronoglycomyces albus TaxID=2811108 RepID=A0A895XU66_9ACTN|nr:slipin family protein [Natronoglycomyces albus]QSB05790.1 slipin family protein [Natronoglycomyces albus]
MATVIVHDWERVLLFTDGTLQRTLEPGRHRYRKRNSFLHHVDMRPAEVRVPGQEVLTNDGISVRVSVTAQWRVADPVTYLMGSQLPDSFLYSSLQGAIRHCVCEVDFATAIGDRSAIDRGLLAFAQEEVASFGIELDQVRVRDVMMPGALRRAAMDVAIAREEGKASLEAARSEAAALRSLTNTAKLLEKHPQLMQLRTLQVAQNSDATLVIDPRAGVAGTRSDAV